MNTVARPATSEPGIFAAATAASAAASYWIGPSTSSSGARSRTSAVAARTFSTSAPEPDSPVEYDSIAMRGSMPNCVAVAADEIAMSASCSRRRVGDDGAVAVDEHAVGERHQEHATRRPRRPGLVLMISNAGRIVCAVVCAAPETMPSARPRCTMSVPKYETSVTVSAACA